jgi:hypothetical protein
VVRLREGRKWIPDHDNMVFPHPNTKTWLKFEINATQKGPAACGKERSFGQAYDVFAQLPEELRTEILTWLPNEDVAALRVASRTVSEVQLSATFWFSQLNAPELQMAFLKNFKEACAGTNVKKDIFRALLRSGLLRTRTAHMDYEALWYVNVYSTIRQVSVDEPHWLSDTRPGDSLKVHCGLRSGTIPFAPHWFSAVRFEFEAPFRSFNKMTMFFHTTRRQFHHTTDGVGQIDQDRYLTGIRFESAISKDLGHCHGQVAAQIIIPEDQRFDSLMLRIYTNNRVSIEALCWTDGNVKTKQ